MTSGDSSKVLTSRVQNVRQGSLFLFTDPSISRTQRVTVTTSVRQEYPWKECIGTTDIWKLLEMSEWFSDW